MFATPFSERVLAGPLDRLLGDLDADHPARLARQREADRSVPLYRSQTISVPLSAACSMASR